MDGGSALPKLGFQGQFLLVLGLSHLLPGLPRASAFPLRGAVLLTVPEDLVTDTTDGLLECGLFQLALPDDDDRPALRLQLAPDFLISLLVAGNLGRPEFCVGFRDMASFATFVTVPEAAVDEDDSAVLREDDVRGAGETFDVHSVTESEKPEGITKAQFRLR